MEYTIREISKMFSLNASTLRYYEELGLLTNVEKNESGQRVYRECHVARLRSICCFKNAGMTMHDLQEFFYYEENKTEYFPEMVSILENRRQLMQEKIEEMQKDYAHLLRKIRYYSDSRDAQQRGEQLPVWKDYKQVCIENMPNYR